jgi:hypothetical protein
MKRTFLPYVAIVAALVAGTVCSTAFAGGGMKFGGGNFRSMSGNGNNGGNNGGSSQMMRKFNTGGSGPKITLGSNNGFSGNGNSSSKPFKPQIIRGNGNGNGTGISGINLGQGSNHGNINRVPKFDIKKNNNGLPFVGQLPGNGQNKIVDKKFGQDKKLGIQIGNGGIQIGGQQGIQIGKHNGQHSQHGKCNNLSNWCDPHHWPCYKPCYPCHKPVCYQETVYVYSQPIVVQVAAPVEQLMQVPAGATLTLQAPNLGEAPGQVVLQMEKVAMAGLVREWKLDTVTASLPPMELAAPVIAEILILRADGSLANGMKVELIPAAPVTDAAIAPPAAGLDAASQAAAALGM